MTGIPLSADSQTLRRHMERAKEIVHELNTRQCGVTPYDESKPMGERSGQPCQERATVKLPTCWYGKLIFLYLCPFHAESHSGIRVDPTEPRFDGQRTAPNGG